MLPPELLEWPRRYPPALIQSLVRLLENRGRELYLTGGAIRDLLLGSLPRDLDFTVPGGPLAWIRGAAAELGGTIVELDREEGVYRLVWQEYLLDFAQFRENSASLEADLRKRDFTINALALPLRAGAGELHFTEEIVDPTGGRADLAAGLIRATSREVFRNDPLRLLRAYRFRALLGFALERQTGAWIRELAPLLAGVSAERISYELQRIMESNRAAETIGLLAESKLLWVVFPELRTGVGMAQPASHHLDVFSHNLETLRAMEEVQAAPEGFFGGSGAQMRDYLARGRRGVLLRWAALFHDLGKPATFEQRGERLTFYNHDQAGAARFLDLARRLRWSREEGKRVARFIELHMWPFHLNNARQRTGITAKACLRLVKAAGEDLPGLFLLAMADTLAGQGPGRPPAAEQSLAALYAEVDRVNRESIRPVLRQPRLLNGHDLQKLFGLQPGPFLGQVLEELETAQVDGKVRSRAEAEQWVWDFLRHQ